MEHLDINDFKLLNIEFSSVCNLHCRWCSLDHSKPIKFLSLEIFESVLKQVANNEFPSLCRLDLHNGGEVLLHPQFDEAMKILAEIKPYIKIPISLLTNGTKLIGDKVDSLLDGRPVDEVRISVDGGSPELFEYIRCGAKWKQVSNNIREFATNSKRIDQGVGLGIICVMPPGKEKNETVYFTSMDPEFLDIINLAIGNLQLMRPLSWDGSINVDGITADPSMKQGRFCCFLRQQMVVLASGEVTTCCVDLNGKNIIGNTAIQSLASIWNGAERTKIIEMWMDGRANEINGCGKCEGYYSWFGS